MKNDPTASSTEYGVPLLPAEIADRNRRAEQSEAIVPVIQAYGAQHADVFGGLYIDQQHGGAVTVMFTRDVAAHEAALRAALKPGARLVVRQVRWAEADLLRLQDAITADRGWLESIGARFSSSSTDTIGNVVEVRVSSANPDAARLIIEHYQADGKLKVSSDGTGVLLLPLGRLVGRVVDRQGRPVAGADVEYEPLFDVGPLAGTGHGTDANGRFEIGVVVPGKWRVYVMAEGVDMGCVEVVVPPGGVAEATVVLAAPLPSS